MGALGITMAQWAPRAGPGAKAGRGREAMERSSLSNRQENPAAPDYLARPHVSLMNASDYPAWRWARHASGTKPNGGKHPGGKCSG